MSTARAGRRAGRHAKGTPSFRALTSPGATALADSFEPITAGGGGVLARMGAVFAISAKNAVPGSQWVLNEGTGGQVLRARYGSVGRAETRSGSLILPGTSGNGATVADSAALDITRDVELLARLNPDTWAAGATAQTIAAKRTTAPQASWQWRIKAGSRLLELVVSSDGTALFVTPATQPIPFADGEAGWLKTTWRAADGLLRYYYAPDSEAVPATWTQIGLDVTLAAGVIAASSTPVEIGARNGLATDFLPGVVKRFVLRSGIDGPAVLDVDFAAASDLSASFTADHGIGIKGGALVLPSVSGVFASAPDSAALDIAGDVEIVVRARLKKWADPTNTQALLDKAGSTAGYGLRVATNGRLAFAYGDGATYPAAPLSSVAPPLVDGTGYWLKGTFQPNDGAGGNTTRFFYAPDGPTEPGPSDWLEIGSPVVVAGVTTIGNSPQIVSVGAISGGIAQLAAGSIYRGIVRNGIGGSAVLDVDFATQPNDTQSFVCSTGQTITVNGCARPTVTITAANAVDTNDPLLLIPESSVASLVITNASADGATIPHQPEFAAMTGDLEVVQLGAIDGGAALNAGGRYVVGDHSFYWGFTNTNRPRFIISTDGTNVLAYDATAAVTPGVLTWIKRTRRASDGRIQFFTAPFTGTDTEPSPAAWSQLGTDVTGASGPLFTPVTSNIFRVFGLGGSACLGRWVRTIVRNGIGGTTVLDASVAPLRDGDTVAFPCATGQTVTLTRATVGRKAVLLVPGQPLWLFGVDDFLEVADNALVNMAAGDSFTLLAVVRQWSAPLSFGRIIDKLGATGPGYTLLNNSTSSARYFSISDGTTTLNAAPATAYPIGALVLSAGVRDGAARTGTVYNNATIGGPQADTTSGTLTNSVPLRIGNNWNASAAQDVEIFDVGIFRWALTADEIAYAIKQIGAAA